MAGVYNIEHKDKKIFCLDVSGLQLKDKKTSEKLLLNCHFDPDEIGREIFVLNSKEKQDSSSQNDSE